MEDLKFVKKLMERDNAAWSTFIDRFDLTIRRRIKQIFFRYSFRETSADLQEAYDFVVDHFLFGKTFSTFRKDQSLDGFVHRVTTNAVIDWYRKRSSERSLYGVHTTEIMKLANINLEIMADENDTAETAETPFDIFVGVQWNREETLVLAVMTVRTVTVGSRILSDIASESESSHEEISKKIENLRDKLHEQWSKKSLLYDEIGFLWLRSLILERRGDTMRSESRKTLLDKRISEYKTKGIEPYPTRKEIADILKWDINKVDRIKRRIEEKLKNYIKTRDQQKHKSNHIA